MILNDLIERGFFPKELPPPFSTKKLAQNSAQILVDWNTIFIANTNLKTSDLGIAQDLANKESNSKFKERKKEIANAFIAKYASSVPTDFSISKGKFSRRYLRIPNPKHFLILSDKICKNWPEFAKIFQLSNYSKSYPVIETDVLKRTVRTFSKNVADFRNQLIAASFNKTIELRIDISKFYPTIYTHSVTWALLGKELAKKYFKQKDELQTLIESDDTNASLYKIANEIDIAIRACQGQQSIGIPIGPDTSHIIAELIACRIDNILFNQFANLKIKCCRYYDDFYIYVNSKDEANKVLKGLQKILGDFQLEINESKIQIKEFPFAFEDDFSTTITQFIFKKTKFDNSIRHYFSLIWNFADKNPNKADTIFKYALRTFEYRTTEIPKKSWRLFEALLFKTALIEPSTLDIVSRILLTYNSFIDDLSKDKIRELIELVITNHSEIKHNFEVAWALWLAKIFDIEITEICGNLVVSMKDPISILILLDLHHNKNLVNGMIDWSIIENELKDNILFSELWLLAYEATKKGWLNPANPNLLDDNLFFKKLKDLDIEFYDINQQISIYPPVKKPQTIENLVVETDTYQTTNKNNQDRQNNNNQQIIDSQEFLTISNM